MTVRELKNYLDMLCHDGKQHAMVLFAEKPFDSQLLHVEAFSSGADTVTLTSRDNIPKLEAA